MQNNKAALLFVLVSMSVSAIAQAAEFVVSQKDKQFQIDEEEAETLDVRVGDTVKFINEDNFFHSIFSTSAAKTFDLGRSTTGQSDVVTFEEKGTVEVECKIHRSMYIEINVQ